MGHNKRILYLQHANPAAFPPLEYSSHMFADGGWDVRFIGVHSRGPEALAFTYHPRIHVTVLPYERPGWRQKISYARFMSRAIYTAFRWKPDWVYVVDALATPVGVLLLKLLRCKVIYHEHDAPPLGAQNSWFMAQVLKARRALARADALNILPQQERASMFKAETATLRPVHCVWNCPPKAAAAEAVTRMRQRDEALAIYFHGSINLERVPLSLIAGASLCAFPVRIRIVGYETIGSTGASDQLRAAAAAAHNVVLELPGPVSRRELRALMQGMHVGWINYINRSEDANLHHLMGASNKAFDYLAASLPMIVPDSADWRTLYVEPGYAIPCNAADALSVANALRWFYENPLSAAEMGLKGRQRILEEWHYERQFRKVFEVVNRDLVC